MNEPTRAPAEPDPADIPAPGDAPAAEAGDPAPPADGAADSTGAGPVADPDADPAVEGVRDIDADPAARLAAALAEIKEMKEGYIRARADVENVRRRSQNEITAARKYAIEGFAGELLGVVDSLDQASKVELGDAGGEAVQKMREGLELTVRQFHRVLEKFGVTEVEAAPGVRFDPDRHQAISVVPDGAVAPDHIVEVMQKGFVLKDRLLRPAMVVIARAPDSPEKP